MEQLKQRYDGLMARCQECNREARLVTPLGGRKWWGCGKAGHLRQKVSRSQIVDLERHGF